MKPIRFFIFAVTFSLVSVGLTGQTEIKSWEQLRQRPYPQWFKDAKLGIFIHWGLYSVPSYGGPESYGEWFLLGLKNKQPGRVEFVKRNYGENFSYRDFASIFKAELFDPNEWADIFKASGAGYIVLVSKHHDGYCLWPSRYAPRWNTVETGPHRDIVGELKKAVEAKGLRFGLYYSLPEWGHPLHDWYSSPNDSIAPYVEQHMIPQFKELVENYRPSLIFSDGEWFNSAEQWHARELISWYYDLVGSDAIVNDRWGHGADIGFITPEYSSGGLQTNRPWAEVRGLGRSFGLNRNEKLSAYMTSDELIRLFIRTVANGGGLIINVGPAADGQIPLLQQERLVDLGKWIATNKEAIYGAEKYILTGQEKPVVLERTDARIHFDWVRNTPGQPIAVDQFTATWAGFIKADKTDIYTFSLEADDGVKLFINNKLLIDRWEARNEGTDSEAMRSRKADSIAASIKLKKDEFVPIRVEFHEEHQNASVSLSWQSNQLPKEVVPQSNLFTEADLHQGDGLKATYRSLKQYLAYTQKGGNLYAIAFEWPNDDLVLNIPKPDNDVNITLLGNNKILTWRYEYNQLHIDVSSINPSEIIGTAVWTFKLENYLKK